MSLLPHLSQAISSPCSPMFKLVPFFPRAPLARDPYNLWQTEQIVRSRPGSEELAPASYTCWAPTKLRYARSIQLGRMDIKHTKQVTRKQSQIPKNSQPCSFWVHWILPSLSESQIEVPMHSCAAPGSTSTPIPTWVAGFRCLASWRGTCKCGLWYVIMEYAAFILPYFTIIIHYQSLSYCFH